MVEKYLRMTLNERIQHLNLFINFSLLVITGFALKYPEAFWVSPISDVPSGMTIRGLLHRLSGIAILTLGAYHLLYIFFTRRGRGILRDMIPWVSDLVHAWETLKNNLYINRPAKKIQMGRFNFREKAEYLGLIWGTLVMTVTGFILWFQMQWLQFFPKWTFDVARAIHFYEAILATLTIIVWHFYSVVFSPDVYPMSWAWLSGNLTEHEMEEEHGLELKKIKAGENSKVPELPKAAGTGGGRVYPLHRQKEGFSVKRLLGTVRNMSESIRKWQGE